MCAAACVQKTVYLTVLRTANQSFPMQSPLFLDIVGFAFEFWVVQLHLPRIVLLRNLTMLLTTVYTAKGKRPLIRLVWKYFFWLLFSLGLLCFPPLTLIATLAWIYVLPNIVPNVFIVSNEEIYLLYCTCELFLLSNTCRQDSEQLKRQRTCFVSSSGFPAGAPISMAFGRG